MSGNNKMLIKQIYMDNDLRNFNYLVTCSETGDTLAIDPFAADTCLKYAQENNLKITQVLNTHEHWDHIGGNDQVVKYTNAKILAHYKANIPNVNVGLRAGDIVKVGQSVELEVLDTPGHTYCHICLLSKTKDPALFSGDTIFNASCGNCHSGDPNTMYNTFNAQLFKLPNNTKLYPGHDYIQNNLNFALSREPDNQVAIDLLKNLEQKHNPHAAMITTLGQEKQYNPFFRLDNLSIIEKIRAEIPNLKLNTPEDIFVALRNLRDKW